MCRIESSLWPRLISFSVPAPVIFCNPTRLYAPMFGSLSVTFPLVGKVDLVCLITYPEMIPRLQGGVHISLDVLKVLDLLRVLEWLASLLCVYPTISTLQEYRRYIFIYNSPSCATLLYLSAPSIRLVVLRLGSEVL